MAVTVRELKQWIEDSGLTDDSILQMDGDGETVLADVPGKVAVAYLKIGEDRVCRVGGGQVMATKRTWTNADRAEAARQACERYARLSGQSMDDEFRTVIQDLVSDLMHLCHQDGGDAHRMVRLASDHFQVEYSEEEFGGDE